MHICLQLFVSLRSPALNEERTIGFLLHKRKFICPKQRWKRCARVGSIKADNKDDLRLYKPAVSFRQL